MNTKVRIGLSLAVAALFSVWLVPQGLNASQRIVQGILALAVTLWLTDAVPAFAVSVLVMFLSVAGLGLTGDKQFPTEVLYHTWSSPVIFLMLGGFFLAEAITLSGLDKQIVGNAFKRFGSSPSRLLLGVMLTTGVLSMLMSNTATTAMMLAAVVPLIKKQTESDGLRKGILIGISTAAAIGGIGTAIGSPPNAISIAAVASRGQTLDFVGWMLYGLPLSVILLLVSWLAIHRYYRLDSGHAIDIVPGNELKTEVKGRALTIVTLLTTLILWLTTPLHGFHAAAIAAIPITVFVVTGLIGPDELKSLPWDTLMLVAGGLTLGEAISQSGLASYYVSRLDLTGSPTWLIILAFGYLTVLMSNIMSNTATASLLIPVGMSIMPGQAMEIAVMSGLCASYAILLPVSTPPNAIVFSSGYLKQSDFRVTGLLMALIGPPLTLLWIEILAGTL